MSQALNGGKNRIEYLDYLRGVLMALGVVTHVAYVYTVRGDWRISDAHAQSVVFDGIINFLHLFRLQSFFILSGFLFALSATKKGTLPTFVKRASRIGVPLVTVLLLLNTIEVYVCQHIYRKSLGLPVFDVWQLNQSAWIGHLWFLVYLLGFHLVAVAVGAALERVSLPKLHGEAMARYMVYVPILAAIFDLAVRATTKIFPAIHSTWVGLSFYDWLLYLPFYVVGVVAGTNRAIGAELSRIRMPHFIMLGVSALLSLQNPLHGIAGLIVDRMAHVYIMWSCCIMCFWLFEQLCNIGGETLRFIKKISEASYTIYLFHHLTVILVGLAIMNQNWPVWVKFIVVLTVAVAISYALHRLVITRVPVLAFLFNGVPLNEQLKRPFATAPETALSRPTSSDPTAMSRSILSGLSFSSSPPSPSNVRSVR